MKRLVRRIRGVLFLLLGLVILFGVYVLFFSKAEIYGIDSLSKLPRSKEVSLRVSDNVSHVSIYLVQGSKRVLVLSEDTGENKSLNLLIEPGKLDIRDGKAKLLVELERYGFMKEVLEREVIVDTQPPRVNIVHSPYAVRQGGSGAVRVSVNEPARLSVSVGDKSYGFFKLREGVFVSIFPVPADTPVGSHVYVVARDEAGNVSRINTGIVVKATRFKRYRINLDLREDRVLKKLSDILGRELSREEFVEAFVEVNEKVRRENEEKIRKMALESVPERLWRGGFLQMKNSKVISVFGERRDYFYRGKFISSSRHWGYDLASVKNAPVEAANGGRVIFTGYIGIYGNVVMIDHGYGIVSLYAHLAEFKVKEGDSVRKGQVIGITDATGLAFGDHLHFGVLVQGLEVNPIEWWDSRWVELNIEKAL
jgi:murein DD-endopeptidase MepM/ murein hydrolase activator NlpD